MKNSYKVEGATFFFTNEWEKEDKYWWIGFLIFVLSVIISIYFIIQSK